MSNATNGSSGVIPSRQMFANCDMTPTCFLPHGHTGINHSGYEYNVNLQRHPSSSCPSTESLTGLDPAGGVLDTSGISVSSPPPSKEARLRKHRRIAPGATAESAGSSVDECRAEPLSLSIIDCSNNIDLHTGIKIAAFESRKRQCPECIMCTKRFRLLCMLSKFQTRGTR